MSYLTNSEEAFTRFIEGFRDERDEVKYEQSISEMAVKGQKSIVVDFKDVNSFDTEFARQILDNPKDYLPHFDIVAFSKLRMRDPIYADEIKRVHVRFRGLPTETLLHRIGAEHIGRLIMVNGIIVRATKVQPFITKAAFLCSQCGETILLEQTDQLLKTPRECPSCNSRRRFNHVPTESVFVDSQQFFISGTEEEMVEFYVEIFDDIVGTAEPGEHVVITGVVGARLVGKTRVAKLYIKGNHLEIERKSEVHTREPGLQAELEKVLGVITEMERITSLVRDDDLFETLMEDHGVIRAEAARLIGVLMRNGTIYSPRPGYYKKTV